MKVKFDTSYKIAGIGIVPWARLGLERWFPNYAIATLYDWDVNTADAPIVYALKTAYPKASLESLSTQALLSNLDFRVLLKNNVPGHNLLTYKPVQIPSEGNDFQLIASDSRLSARLENKVQFRHYMAAEGIPFPAYKVYDRAALEKMSCNDVLSGRDAVILQDERLSGGKGTFVIRDETSLRHALDSLRTMRCGTRVVVSDYVTPAYERSVQCCVTRYGIFVGPLQKQIVAEPILANTQHVGSDMFCGAEISRNDSMNGAYAEIERYARKIGKQMQSLGYKGIFGLDCMIDTKGRVYVLEVNARITGVTPLLSMLYRDGRDIPFYLLHVLELSNMDYTLEDNFIDTIPQEGSLMIVHDQSTGPGALAETLRSGLYSSNDVAFREAAIRFKFDTPNTEVLVQQYIPRGLIKAGAKLLNVYSRGSILAADDALLPATEQLLCKIRRHIQVDGPSIETVDK